MKNHFYSRLAFLLVLPLFLFSCEAIEDATQFDISQPLPDVEITVDTNTFTTSGVEVLIAETSTSLNLDSIKEAHGLESFEAAEFDYVKLELVNPADVNLDWIQSLRATVSTPSIAETDVATYTRVNPAGNSIDLTLNEQAVLNYVTSNTFSIKVYAKVTLPLPAPVIDMLLKSKLKMTVQPV